MALVSLDIEGLGQVSYNPITEYITRTASDYYLDKMGKLKEVIDLPFQSVADSDYDKIVNAINQLKDYAQKGVAIDGVIYYMSPEMLYRFNDVLKFMQAVGIPATGTPDKVQLVHNWRSLAPFGLKQTITDALAINTETHSLQSYVELEYVKAGNDMIGTELDSLEKQLAATDRILGELKVVQSIANQIKITSKDFVFPPVNNGDIPFAAWKNLAVGTVYRFQDQTVPGSNIFGLFDVGGSLHTAQDNISVSNKIVAGFVKDWYAALGGNVSLGPNSDPDYWMKRIIDQFNLSGQVQTSVPGLYISRYAGVHHTETVGNTSGEIWTDAPHFDIGINFDYPATPAQLAVFNSRITATTMLNERFAQPGGEISYMAAYQAIASASFTQLYPTAAPTATSATDLLAAKEAIIKILHDDFSADQVDEVNSIGYLLRNVARDISAAFLSTPNNVTNWILDNQDKKLGTPGAENVGNIASNITLAVQKAESTNDVQKEKVRQFMFMFEQFYKSASAVLQKVSQMIESMAQGIGR